MVGCSTQSIILGHTTPLDIYIHGDSRKTTVNETLTANIGTTFVAPNGPTLSAGVGMNKGRGIETTASRWEVMFNDVARFEEAHLIDDTYTSVDGGFWIYTPNPDFGNINRATFIDLAPLGVFHSSEVAPTKLEMKVLSFWELPSQPESARRWILAIMSHRRRQIPAFANFISGISTVVDLQNVPDQGMKVLLEDESEAPLSEDPFRTVKRSLQGDLEVPLVSAIMGRASLSKSEYRGQGSLLF
jgi:hypothetical protein